MQDASIFAKLVLERFPSRRQISAPVNRLHAASAPSSVASLRRGFFVAAAALDPVLEYEATAMAVHMTGAETKEGVAAFLDKRPPRFS